MLTKKITILNILIPWFLTTGSLCAANPVSPHSEAKSIFELLNHKEILEVDLAFGIKNLIADRHNEESTKGIFAFKDADNNLRKWDIKISMRGNYRRTHCTAMPPLRLDFKKKDLTAHGLAEFDDMKLVTQCIKDEETAQKILLKEYLAYKIYHQITEKSFRVQLLKINYTDITSGKTSIEYGFLIEDTAEMRNRIGAQEMDKVFNIAPSLLDRQQFKTVALFQYMIGNIDWKLSLARNLKFVKANNEVTLIPYDFDFSEFVAAPYRTGSKQLNVVRKGDRAFLGFKEDLEDMDATIKVFKAQKKSIIDMVNNFKALDIEDRIELREYISSFYEGLSDIQVPPVDIYANHQE